MLIRVHSWLITCVILTISRGIEKGFSRDSAQDDLPAFGLSALSRAIEGQ